MSDYIIFKFKKIDKNLLNSLVNSEIYFARPDRLNDPFDCQVDILASFERAISRSTGQTHNKLKQLRESINMEKIKTTLANIGVCSFSLEQKNTLMWSHYADRHCGACLTYELTKSFFDITTKEILGIVPVDYGFNPLSDWLLWEAHELTIDEFFRVLILKALTAKAKLWKYEKEVRILRWEEGAQVIDKQFLKEICFGLATPDSDINLLKNIVRQCGYKVNLRKVVRNTSNDFGLKPIKI